MKLRTEFINHIEKCNMKETDNYMGLELVISHIKDRLDSEKKKGWGFGNLIFWGILAFGILTRFIGGGNQDKSSDLKFEKASVFENVKLINKEKDLHTLVEEMVKITNYIDNCTHKELTKILDPSNFAFMLYGPPGTGKTSFVQQLSYEFDLRLRQHFLRNQFSGGKLDVLAMYMDIESYALRNVGCKVEYLFIQPSKILDKYAGVAEKNIKKIFDELYNLPAGVMGRVMLMDEGEAFFRSREKENVMRSESSGSITAEFLTRISQVPTKYQPVFIFTCTNLKDDIDKAFMRRFGRKYFFDLPDSTERLRIINKILESCKEKVSDEEKSEIMYATDDCSQAFLSRTLKLYIERGLRKGTPIRFKTEEFISFVSELPNDEKF